MKFEVGDLVMLIDSKGRRKMITLEPGKKFFSHTGAIEHDTILQRSNASIVESEKGSKYLVIRPLLRDFVLSMPRGAAIIYPKDTALIIGYSDLYPGAKVLEAGVGSGALSASILRAIGREGHLISYERREEFADIARKNVQSFFAEDIHNWTIEIGDVKEARDLEVSHVFLDMLEPWLPLEAVTNVLSPGGVLVTYVATTTQMSMQVEAIRSSEFYTEPEVLETLLRPWHVEGLAVRPEHRMMAHTGFLIFARKMAEGHVPLPKRRKNFFDKS